MVDQPCLLFSLEKYAVQVFSPGEVGRESNTEVFMVVIDVQISVRIRLGRISHGYFLLENAPLVRSQSNDSSNLLARVASKYSKHMKQ